MRPKSITLVMGFAVFLSVVLAGGQRASAHEWTTTASCKAAYGYAGGQDSGKRSGIRAYVTMVNDPKVSAGHVAGWLGFGGPGLGPNGTDMWLQTGYVAFHDGPRQIYYEVTLPGKPPAYHEVKAKLKKGEKHQLTVLEVGGKAGSWRVWLDGKAVSPVMALSKSHGRFSPQALGETWNADSKKCNGYVYRFDKVQIAKAPGGSWTSGKAGFVWKDQQNKVVKLSGNSFEARSATAYVAPPQSGPPLFPRLSSLLTHRALTAECAAQSEPVREQPTGHLLLSTTVCERLLGYAVVQPYAPGVDTAPGFAVAVTALDFLRGLARVAHVDRAHADCRAVGWFSETLHTFGATPRQAGGLRAALLRGRAKLSPPLSFQPGCRFR